MTYALIALNAAAYLYGTYVLGTGTWRQQWALIPDPSQYIDFVGGGGDEWYRWVTSGFLHFGLLHLGMNMFVLWQFGSQLESALGRVRFAVLYAISLVGGSAGVLLLASSGVHGGASGAIFGLIAAYAVVLKRLRLPFQQVAFTAGLWLVLGFVIPGISWQGHLGGLVAGALTMLAMFRRVDRVTTE